MWARIFACGTALALLGTGLASEAQSKGYLSKTGPPGLRFRSPPKPSVLWLDPRPITYMPPPALVTEYAEPPSPGREAPLSRLTVAPLALVSPLPDPPRPVSTNQPATITNLFQEQPITTEILVKYFTRGMSNRLNAPLATPIQFRPPVSESRLSGRR